MVLLSGSSPVWPTITDDDGTGQTGTILNAAVFTTIKQSIEGLIHSTTNTTVSPAALIDEVVNARGSKANLDARLDVVLNEDGTLKTQSSLVSAATYAHGLGSHNLAKNGDLDNWTLGGALAPDNFTLSGASATVARTGPSQSDTFSFTTNTYAVKVTRAGGNNAKLTQIVIDSAIFANFADAKAKVCTVFAMGKTAIANHLRLVVDDAATQTGSAYHAGNDAAAVLSTTHTISNSATKLEFYMSVEGSNGDAYCGGFMFLFSDAAPTEWMPLSYYPAPRTIFNVVATVGNVGAGEDVLASCLVSGAMVPTNNMSIRGIFWGKTANNAAAKTIRLRTIEGANNTVLISMAATVSQAGHWILAFQLMRTGTATSRSAAQSVVGPTNSDLTKSVGNVEQPVITWANGLEIRLSGEATNNDDITVEGGGISVIPAAT